MLIGGLAVIAYGAERATKDIDLLVDASPENIALVKRALVAALPDGAAAEVADNEVGEYAVVRVSDEVVVDLMARAYGVTYAEAVADSETLELEGVEIPIASNRLPSPETT